MRNAVVFVYKDNCTTKEKNVRQLGNAKNPQQLKIISDSVNEKRGKMNEKTPLIALIAIVALTAAFGLVYTESPSATSGELIVQQRTQVPTRTVTVPRTYTPATPQQWTQTQCSGQCRKWSACGFNVDQLMVNGQPGQCIDAYKAASQKIPYCGKTLALKPCDPFGPNRWQCVCR